MRRKNSRLNVGTLAMVLVLGFAWLAQTALAARIEAEHYDLGGEGVAYHDTTAGNQGGDTLRTDGVDIRSGGTARAITNTIAGEWLKYKVNITESGHYDLTLRVASGVTTGKFHVTANGVNITGPLAVPNTGGSNTWANVGANVQLQAGVQYLKIYVEGAGADLDYFVIGDDPTPVTVTSVSSGLVYPVEPATVGLVYYTDNTYTITSLSGNLLNQLLIRTANADRFLTTASHLSFTLREASTVYVAYDRRRTSLPAWLSAANGWTLTSESMVTNDAASPFLLYSKSYPAGSVTLGGNLQPPAVGSGSNYVVIVRPNSAIASFMNINAGAAQRSQIQSTVMSFDGPVTLDAGAFVLTHRTSGAVTVTPTSTDGGQNWSLSFSGTLAPSGRLVDGVYDLTVVASKVHATGRTLSGDRLYTFHRLFGDYDGNKTVNNVDIAWFRRSLDTSSGGANFLSLFDYEQNGTINNVDLAQFRRRIDVILTY